MKHKRSPFFFIASLALVGAAAHAADLTWDNSASAGIQVPASGTWTNGGGGWSTNGTTLVNWSNSPTANTAVFGGADGTYTVTVGGAIPVQKIRFANSGYTLSAASARTITLSSPGASGQNPGLMVVSGNSATIGSNVTVTASTTLYVGADNATAGGTLNIEGGTVRSGGAGASTVIDGNGTIVNVKTGGLLANFATSPTGSVSVGQLANSNATLNVQGGTVTVGGTGTFHVGNQGRGTVTLTTGNISVASSTNGVTFGNSTTSGNNVLNLDGGTLTAGIIKKGGGAATATFNFNGGLLKANASNTSFMTGLTTANVKIGGARFDTNGFNVTVEQALVDNGSGGLSKEGGSGTLTLTGVNTYDGETTISAGTLALSGSGSISNSSLIRINSSTTLSVTGLTGDFTVGSAQTVGGSGTILATGKTVVANGTLSPGSSPGTLTLDGGTLQLGVGGDYNWQIHDAADAAGSGYDTTSLINGATLDLSLLSAGNTYNINLWSLSGLGPDVNGDAINFDNTLSYSWTLFSTGTAITGFSTDKFTINTGIFNATNGFTNALGGGTFSVALADGNTDLVLNFTAVPEPRAILLGCLGFLALLRRRR